MKKYWILMTALLCAWNVQAAYYGIVVNGTTYFAGEPAGEHEGFQQYLAHVQVQAGDYCQLYDAEYKAAWAVPLNSYSVEDFTYDAANQRYHASVSGCYDFYIKLKYGEDQLYIGNGDNCGSGEDVALAYGGSVPPQCEDVLLQAFYNESYSATAPGVNLYGDTKWNTLLPQADELGSYFDLIWLPPSANGDGMGYHPKQYSNQNSNWGTRAELEALIAALHNAGAKVVADIVINHCTGWTSWCDFPTMDFGEYGVFYPDASYICQDDEVNLNPEAGACYGTATGNYDDGQNWDGARDWAHDMPKVQNMFIAYLKWMREVMHYDGFRYDKGDGFNNWHHDNYNKHAKPYIAFMECYSGTDEIQNRIDGANGNLMGLDFDLKWHVFNSFAGWDYSRGRGDCLMSRGKGKQAVTFIESHDWFLRPDNENEFGGRGNSMKPELKARLMQANAFLLSMPGVPCVFYPHWQKYKADLKPMIDARKLAGVHSESGVWDESSTATGYQATIGGKYGYLILCLGDKANGQGFGSDYQLKASNYSTQEGHNESYEIWVNRTEPLPSGVEEIGENAQMKAEKILRDGRLYIRLGGKMYDMMGAAVR